MDESTGSASATGDSRSADEGRRLVADGGRNGASLDDGGAEALPAAIGGVPAPVVAFDGSGTFLDANGAFEELTGYSVADLRGESLGRVFPSLSASTVAQRCDESADGTATVTTPGVTADGTNLWLDLSVERRDEHGWYVAAAHDVTDYRSRAETREQYERIVQTIDDGIYVLDDAFNVTAVNDAVEDLTGYSRSELVGSNATMLASEETIEKAAAVSEALLSSDSSAATITTTIETADGSELPIETVFSVYQFADGSYGQVGVFRDISDRIWFEEALTALHDSTRDLLHTETRAAVCDLVVRTATDVVDLSAAVVYLFDRDENLLRPAATATDAAETVEDTDPVGAGGGVPWEAFVTGERQVDRSGPPVVLGEGTELSAECGVAVPLGDHGVFFVATADVDCLDPKTEELVDLVAASAEAGLDRVDREERLRESDRELREHNERLRRLETINEVIRRIDQAMVGAESRDGVESAVCEELAGSDLFSFAWVGRPDGADLVPGASAGDERGYLDAVDLSLDGDGGPPGVRTARSGEPTLVPSVATDLHSDQWRTEALSRDFGSALAVPLRFDDVTYGVLTVYAARPEAFDERMQSVFAELGQTIANAVRVVETRRWLSVESVVELELAVRSPTGPLARLATAADCRLVHEGTVPGDDASRTFVRVEDGDADAVRAAAADLASVEVVRGSAGGNGEFDDELAGESETGTDRSADGSPLLELRLPTRTVPTTLTERGSRLRSLAVEPDAIEATVELAPTASVRGLVDALDSRFGDAALEARRERADPAPSEAGFRAAVREGLTDRQWQVLRSAYLSGFFDWPRETTGEELADSFDVSQPTINRHLRVAERKLLERLFDEE
ncbi:MAG: PAS domain S-box protein [Haloarculaceae archaeon]